MSTTIIENLQEDGATPPSGDYLRAIAGVNDQTNKIAHLQAQADNGLSISPSYNASTVFGRFRTGAAYSLFDNKQIYAKDTLFWTESLVTGGTSTFLTNEAAVELQVTTTSGSSVTRQTRQFFTYQPGRGQLIFITGVMGAIKANVRQRIGYFNENNGLFFEQDGTNLRVVRRTYVSGAAVDSAVNRSSWNIDPLDGTGRSGYNLDTSQAQIFVIDFSWLGVGTIRFGVFDGTRVAYCHEFALANTLTTVWSQTPCLPIRFEITNTGATASSTSMKQICGAVLSEGGLDPLGLIVSANTGTTTKVVTATETPLIGVRLTATYNRATIIPLSFDILSTSNNNLIVRVYVRATLSGGAWVASTGVASEINITPTGVTTTGAVLIATAYISSSSQRAASALLSSSLVLGADFAGTASDELVVTAQNVTAGNNDTYASLHWKEIY